MPHDEKITQPTVTLIFLGATRTPTETTVIIKITYVFTRPALRIAAKEGPVPLRIAVSSVIKERPTEWTRDGNKNNTVQKPQ
jgi:hypothetical protein